MWDLCPCHNTATLFPLEGHAVCVWETAKNITTTTVQTGHKEQRQGSPLLIMYGGVGGYGGGNNNVYILDESMQWKRVQCSPSPSCKEPDYGSRYEHSMSICDEKSRAFMFGGRSGRSKYPLGDTNLYALYLDTFTWEKVPIRDIAPTVRFGHTTCVVGKKLFLFGGVLASGSPSDEFWVFDTDEHAWEDYQKYTSTRAEPQNLAITIENSPVRKSPQARYHHQMCAVNGYIYILGGTGAKNTRMRDIWRLNIKTGEWTEIEITQHNDLIPSAHSSAVVVGKKILMYGGQVSDNQYLRTVLVFDTLSNSLTPLSSSQTDFHGVGISRHAMAIFGLELICIAGKLHLPSYFNATKYAEEMHQYFLGVKINATTVTADWRKSVQTEDKEKVEQEAELKEQQALEAERQGWDFQQGDTKVEMIAEIIFSDEQSQYSRRKALEFLIEIKGDSMQRIYANGAVQTALVKTISTGADRDMLLVSRILHRYFTDTDKGTVPIELAKPMLKFIISYLTLVNSMVEIQRTMRITDPIIMSNVHSNYMGLFGQLCHNWEFYESLTDEMIKVFQQCFGLDNRQHEVIDTVQRSAANSFKFLSENNQHFAEKCTEEFCLVLDSFLSKSGQTETATIIKTCLQSNLSKNVLFESILEHANNASVSLPKIESKPLRMDLSVHATRNNDPENQEPLSIAAVKMRSPTGIASPLSPYRGIVSPPTPCTPPESPKQINGILSPNHDEEEEEEEEQVEQEQPNEANESTHGEDMEVNASEVVTPTDSVHSAQSGDESLDEISIQ